VVTLVVLAVAILIFLIGSVTSKYADVLLEPDGV
jgi:hypothetical protein